MKKSNAPETLDTNADTNNEVLETESTPSAPSESDEITLLKAQLAEANKKLNAKGKAIPSGEEYEGEDPRQMVKIQLFKDSGRYNRDLFVMVNGIQNQLPRGVPITVPYYVYMAIKESTTQDAATMRLIEETAKRLNADAPELN